MTLILQTHNKSNLTNKQKYPYMTLILQTHNKSNLTNKQKYPT